jgi:branched-subunit amino acid aminotransferase/4-amino-4-deoxychorismate lyase
LPTQLDSIRVCWVDGSIVPSDQAVVRVDDSAYAQGRSCFTSVRIAEGRPRFAARHIARIRDGARALRLGELGQETVARALSELAAKALPSGEGVIRLQASCAPEGEIHLIGVARTLGGDKATWSAIIAPQPHDGAALLKGQKVTSRLTLSLAAQEATMAGVDEALLLDVEENLVEGTRTNLLIANPDGSLATPPLESGAVAGIARSIVIEQIAEVEQRTISKAELLAAPEIIAINAVRGSRPIVRLDGRSVGSGSPGDWGLRVTEILAGA